MNFEFRSKVPDFIKEHILMEIAIIWFGTLFILFTVLSFAPKNIFNNLELSLGMAFLSALLTVTILYTIINRRDKKAWAKTTTIILNEIINFDTNFIIASLRFLKLALIHFDSELSKYEDDDEENYIKEFLRIANKHLLPELIKKEKILQLKCSDWELFNKILNSLDKDLYSIILLFGDKIDNDTYPEFITIRRKLRALLNYYDIYQNSFKCTIRVKTEEDKKRKIEFNEKLKSILESIIDLNENLIDKNKNRVVKDLKLGNYKK